MKLVDAVVDIILKNIVSLFHKTLLPQSEGAKAPFGNTVFGVHTILSIGLLINDLV